MNPNLNIDITYDPIDEAYQVDVFQDGLCLYDRCKTVEIDGENNHWDALVAAKNYAHDLISEWLPQPTTQEK